MTKFNSVEDLEKAHLPFRSIIVDVEGDAWQLNSAYAQPWVCAGFDYEELDFGNEYAPFTLIYVPEEG